MHIDHRQFTELSHEVDQLHHESMRTLEDEFAEVHFGAVAAEHREERRSFLKQVAAGGALLTVGSMVTPVGRLLPRAWAQDTPTDAELAAFAAGLELAAVAAYRTAVDTGKLSNATATVGAMFSGHHDEHAKALNAILGEAAVTEPNKTVLAEFEPMISGAADEAAILEIAYGIEEAAASTYLFAIGTLTDAKNAGALGTILPVESQHATVLATVLGKDPSEYLIDFVNEDAALDPADFPA